MNDYSFDNGFDMTPRTKPTPAEKVRKSMLKCRKKADVPISQLADMLNTMKGWSAESFRKKASEHERPSKHWRFAAPNGDTFECASKLGLFKQEVDDEATQAYQDAAEVGSRQRYGIKWKKTGPGYWLNDHGLIEAVCGVLGMRTVEAEQEHKRLKRRREENRQTCPVCFRDICINNADTEVGVMVHHGYTRPGHGEIEGDCFAVNYEPYEVSCRGTKDYLAQIIVPYRKGIENSLVYLKGEPDSIRVDDGTHKVQGVWMSKTKDLKKGEPSYDHELRTLIGRTESDLRSIRREEAMFVKKVADWKKVV